MLHQVKNIVLTSLLTASLTVVGAPVFASDIIWEAETEFNDFRELESFSNDLYGIGYKYCDVTSCTTTIRKQTKGGDFVWEIELEGFMEEETPSIDVNDKGIFATAYHQVAKYSHEGALEWSVDLDIGDLPADTRIFRISNITSDEHGMYLSLRVWLNSGEKAHSYVGMEFDGSINWVITSDVRTDSFATSYWDTEALAINEGVLYGGFNGGVQLVSTAGDLLEAKALDPTVLQSFSELIATPEGIFGYGHYSDAVANTSSYSLLYKLSLSGEIEWSQPYYLDGSYTHVYSNGYRRFPVIAGLSIEDNNLYVHGRFWSDVGTSNRFSLYNINGELLQDQLLSLPEYRNMHRLITVSNNRFFSSLSETFSGDSFESIVEVDFMGDAVVVDEAIKIPSKIFSLGDINADGHQEVAVVLESELYLSASVSPIGVDVGFEPFSFNVIGSANDIKVIADQNSNGSSELALVASNDPIVMLHDGLSGELINSYDFNEFNDDIVPIKTNFLPDINGNGAMEVALLGSFVTRGNRIVLVKDSATGELLNTVYLNPNFTPKDFTFVEDINGDAIPEVAVLSTDANNTSKFEIRSLQGDLIKNIWLGKAYNSTQLVTLPVAVNNEPTLATALGALQTKVNGNGLTVRMMDTQSGTEIQSVNYNSNFNPITAKAISDINSNGTPEVAVLGSNTDTTTGETSTKIEVKDSYSGNLVKNIWQNKTVTPIDLTVVTDINGNGSPETVTLVEQNDSYKAIVKDSLTGELLDTIAIELE